MESTNTCFYFDTVRILINFLSHVCWLKNYFERELYSPNLILVIEFYSFQFQMWLISFWYHRMLFYGKICSWKLAREFNFNFHCGFRSEVHHKCEYYMCWWRYSDHVLFRKSILPTIWNIKPIFNAGTNASGQKCFYSNVHFWTEFNAIQRAIMFILFFEQNIQWFFINFMWLKENRCILFGQEHC